MSYDCRILADSVASGVRLTTLQVTFPRIVLAEFNTHRVFSRNSASSRAIPVEKNIERVLADPFVPVAFGANQKGMQAGEPLDFSAQQIAHAAWLSAMDEAARCARLLASGGVHKQWANRLLEPFAWHTAIVTATEWANFYALRCNAMAAPEIRTIAEMMREAMQESQPEPLEPGEWHLPLVREAEIVDIEQPLFVDGVQAGTSPWHAATDEERVKFCVARCARVSYLTHDGRRDVAADLALYERLLKSGHMSPFEHAAKVATHEELKEHASWSCWDHPEAGEQLTVGFVGNFRAPWLQHRKQISGEAVFRG